MPSPEDTETILAHTRGVDMIAAEMERHWGVGRLPLLVDADLRAKFQRQGLRWRTALEEAWHAKVLTRSMIDAVISSSGGMERAWRALDTAARASGKAPIEPNVWEVTLKDGSVAAIVRTNPEAARVIADGRCLNVWTLEEVANAIDYLCEDSKVGEIKLAFPGAKFGPARNRAAGYELNDPIPF